MTELTQNPRLARDAMAYVLAGGRGSRLMELTDKRAKPAVFFGGKTRIIDFALSNALNSGIRRIAVATQYKAHSLIRHLQRGWAFLRPERNESFDILPASQRTSEDQWYSGTADAVFQNIDIIGSYGPNHIVVLAGDHIYKMDYEVMLEQHVNSGADVTVGCLEVPRMEATGFGVMHVDEEDRIISFLEKPKDPPGMPDKPDMALASMGIYAFEREFLFDQLRRDAADPNSAHDFGKDVIPYLVEHGKAVAHRFATSCVRTSTEEEVLLARRRHGRRLLAGQHRPYRRHPGARSLRPELADLDQCRAHRAGQVRPRFRGPPRRRRSTPWSPAAASSRAPASTARCCSPACAAIPSPTSRARSSCPMPGSSAAPGCATSSSIAASRFPRGWSSARTRSSMPSASGAAKKASASSRRA